jgi:hypothetical protein
MGNSLSIGFLCENWTFRFGKLDDPIFLENSYIHSIDLNLHLYLLYLIPFSPKPTILFYIVRNNMSDNEEERRVMARYDVTQTYQ